MMTMNSFWVHGSGFNKPESPECIFNVLSDFLGFCWSHWTLNWALNCVPYSENSLGCLTRLGSIPYFLWANFWFFYLYKPLNMGKEIYGWRWLMVFYAGKDKHTFGFNCWERVFLDSLMKILSLAFPWDGNLDRFFIHSLFLFR